MNEDQKTDDFCPATHDHKHYPDLNSVHIEMDGGDVYIDVNCNACGRSGCVAKLDPSKVDW